MKMGKQKETKKEKEKQKQKQKQKHKQKQKQMEKEKQKEKQKQKHPDERLKKMKRHLVELDQEMKVKLQFQRMEIPVVPSFQVEVVFYFLAISKSILLPKPQTASLSSFSSKTLGLVEIADTHELIYRKLQ